MICWLVCRNDFGIAERETSTESVCDYAQGSQSLGLGNTNHALDDRTGRSESFCNFEIFNLKFEIMRRQSNKKPQSPTKNPRALSGPGVRLVFHKCAKTLRP